MDELWKQLNLAKEEDDKIKIYEEKLAKEIKKGE